MAYFPVCIYEARFCDEHGFVGLGVITLQSGDDDVDYRFKFPPHTSELSFDKAIPYGNTIASIAITVFDKFGAVVPAGDLLVSSEHGNDYVDTRLKFPVSGLLGRYKITFAPTLSGGSTIEYDWVNLYARDI
jgi:hypothetical protein